MVLHGPSPYELLANQLVDGGGMGASSSSAPLFATFTAGKAVFDRNHRSSKLFEKYMLQVEVLIGKTVWL